MQTKNRIITISSNSLITIPTIARALPFFFFLIEMMSPIIENTDPKQGKRIAHVTPAKKRIIPNSILSPEKGGLGVKIIMDKTKINDKTAKQKPATAILL